MKKTISLLSVLALFSVFSCEKKEDAAAAQSQTPADQTEQAPEPAAAVEEEVVDQAPEPAAVEEEAVIEEELADSEDEEPISSASAEEFRTSLDKMVANLTGIADILEGIKDEVTAKAAVEKLQALKPESERVQGELERLGRPSAEVESALKGEYEAKMNTLEQRVQKVMMSLSQEHPELLKIIVPALQ